MVSAGESLACAGFCGSASGYLLKPDNASPARRAPVRHQTLIKSVLLLEGRAAEEAAAFPSLQQLASKELLTSPVPCTPAPHIHRDWGKSRSCCFSEQSPPAQLSRWFRCHKHTHLEIEPAPGSPSAQQPRGTCLGPAPCCSPSTHLERCPRFAFKPGHPLTKSAPRTVCTPTTTVLLYPRQGEAQGEPLLEQLPSTGP